MQPQKIGFFHAYAAFWKNYGDFGKRTSKEAFWKAWVVHSAIILLLSSPTYFIYRGMIERGDFLSNNWSIPYTIYCLATLIPTIAIIVRRLHDIDRNGGWFFFFLIPIAGQIAFFIMLSRSAAPYDTFPGRSGDGPYTEEPGSRPGHPYAQPPYGQPQNPYAPLYGQPQNTYAPPPYARPDPSVQPYAQPDPSVQPYGPPGSPDHPYALQPSGQPQNTYAPPPYARPDPSVQPYGPPGSPYAPPPYARPPVFKLPLMPPRHYSQPIGGDSALFAIALSIIIAVASSVYGGATSVYMLKNFDKLIDRYVEAFFGDMTPGFGSGDIYGGYDPWGGDYGAGDDWGDPWGDPWGDEWNDGGGGGDDKNAGDELSEEDRSIIDYVRESMLPGFPEFTIEEVLLLCIHEEVLEWECFVFEDGENPSYCIFAMGSNRATDSVFAEFKVHGDGTIAIYNFYDGARDEYGEDAIDLYEEWYEKMLSEEDNAFAA